MKESSIRFEDREYVSIPEFAKRLDVTPQTILNYCSKGILQPKDIAKNGRKYLEWYTQKALYFIAKKKKEHKGTNTKYKKKRSPVIIDTDQEVRSPKVNSIAVADTTIEEIGDITASDTTINLSHIDPNKHTDCWILDENNLPVRDPDGKPRLDYEQLKLKLTDQTYQVKLEKDIGNLIPKEDLIASIQGIGTVFKVNVENIPHKYAAPLIAMCESITGHEFTAEEHTQVMNLLRNVPKEIFPNIQKELEKLTDEYS